jgi:hypothetical protein
MLIRFVSYIHSIRNNTFVIVLVLITPIPGLAITFNHVVLNFVINLLKTPKIKDILGRTTSVFAIIEFRSIEFRSALEALEAANSVFNSVS